VRVAEKIPGPGTEVVEHGLGEARVAGHRVVPVRQQVAVAGPDGVHVDHGQVLFQGGDPQVLRVNTGTAGVHKTQGALTRDPVHLTDAVDDDGARLSLRGSRESPGARTVVRFVHTRTMRRVMEKFDRSANSSAGPFSGGADGTDGPC